MREDAVGEVIGSVLDFGFTPSVRGGDPSVHQDRALAVVPTLFMERSVAHRRVHAVAAQRQVAELVPVLSVDAGRVGPKVVAPSVVELLRHDVFDRQVFKRRTLLALLGADQPVQVGVFGELPQKRRLVGVAVLTAIHDP